MSLQKIILISDDELDQGRIEQLIDPTRYSLEIAEDYSSLSRAAHVGLPLYLVMLNGSSQVSGHLSPLSQTYPVLAVLNNSEVDSSIEVELIRAGVQEAVQFRHLTAELLTTLIERAFARFGSLAPKDQHEQMFKALCDSLTFQMAYRIISLPGERARFIYVSDGVRHISGLSREDVLRDPAVLYNQIIPEDRIKLNAAEELAVGTLTPLELEVRKIDTTGRLRWVHIRSFPRPNGDGGILWDGVESDITGYKLAEEEVKRLLSMNQSLLQRERTAREKSEQNNRMKDEFLASLSHELRTPINAVLGWTQLIQRGVLSDADFDRAIDTIERNARLQAQMIADLLDMSRIISGKVQLELDQVDVRQFMLGVIDTFKPAAEARQIDLRLTIDPRLSYQLTGERSRLQQIFANIISNALKFTAEHGEILIDVKQERNKIVFAITDSGVGIKPEFLPIVFDRFRQADASFSRKFGGLGLGLAIVKQLTELHSGTVNAESAGEGAGSTFTIVLPGSEPSAEMPTEIKDFRRTNQIDSQALKGKQILIVDDEPDALELARQIFIESGATVTTAGSAREAIELLQHDTDGINLIISDIGMPEIDGMQLLIHIREHLPQFDHVPSIALSAFARGEDRIRILNAGYNLHITKPVNANELVECARQLIRREPLVAQSG